MLLLFDLDGPILDVSEKYYRIYTDFLQQYTGAEVLSKKKYWDLKRTRVQDADILALSNVVSCLGEYQEFKMQRIEDESYLAYDVIWPELKEVYEKLFKKHRVVLVTLRTYENKTLWELNNHLQISSWFSDVLSLSGDMYPKGLRWKAKSDALLNSGIDLSFNKKDLFFVGDTETDIKAAKELGIHSIAVSFGIRSRDLLELAEPDIIIDTPCELAEFLKGRFL